MSAVEVLLLTSQRQAHSRSLTTLIVFLLKQLKAVETKLEERVNTQSAIPRGPKLKGTGSTFKCIGMGHQVDAEWDQERESYERRIEELETELGFQQKEVIRPLQSYKYLIALILHTSLCDVVPVLIPQMCVQVCMLNGKLAGAEQMTRDVLSDLLGVKSDMTNVAVRERAVPVIN